ncbi:MAG: hypothetical protein JWM58_196 [Rhizobium sp.]|nr:hypothetical protein [Rhizobium sp.]
MDIERVRQIESDLSKDEIFRTVGDYGVTALAMLVSAIPGAGPVGVAIEKIQQKLFEPDFKGALVALSQELASVEPQLESIESRIGRIEERTAIDSAFEAAFRALVAGAVNASMDPLEVSNEGGTTNVVDVIIDDMKLHSTATNGGITNMSGVTATGSAKFETGPNSEHNISGSHFSSRREGFAASATLNNVAMRSGSKVEIAPPDANVGVRVTRVFGPGEGGAAMTITPSGIVFGGNGRK